MCCIGDDVFSHDGINKQCVVLVMMFFLMLGKGLRHKICGAMNNQRGFLCETFWAIFSRECFKNI